jgi:nitroreductase
LDLRTALESRRSVKKFGERPVTREQIEAMLEAAVCAPNHRMTQPWRFYVLGPEARARYGAALGVRKARKVEDREAARQLAEKVEAEHRNLPAVIAVAMKVAEDPEIREEDYAATMMAVQNLMLAALSTGLGTHIKTGAIMQDPAARSAVGVPEDERIVALVNVGEPVELATAKPRIPAHALTQWRD